MKTGNRTKEKVFFSVCFLLSEPQIQSDQEGRERKRERERERERERKSKWRYELNE